MYLLFSLIFSYVISCFAFYGSVSFEPFLSILMPVLGGVLLGLVIFVVSMFIGGTNPQGGDHNGASLGSLVGIIIFIAAVPLGVYLTGGSENLKENLLFTGSFIGLFVLFVFISLRFKKLKKSNNKRASEVKNKKEILEEIAAKNAFLNSPKYLAEKESKQKEMLNKADELLKDSGVVLDDEPSKK